MVSNSKVSAIEVVPAAPSSPAVSIRYGGDGLRRDRTEGGVRTTYTWDVASSLPIVLQDGSYSYVYGLGLISQTDSLGNQTYLLGNGLGSTEALTDETGNVVGTYKYDAFGAVRNSTGTGSTGYRFTGQEDDSALGYTYLRARYYDSATGRFISKDPFPGVATSPQSLNQYAYTQNSPTNYTDPTGEWVWVAAGAVIGGVSGGAVYAASHWDQIQSGDVNWLEAGAYVGAGALIGTGVSLIAPEIVAGGGTAAAVTATNSNAVQRYRDVGLAAQRAVANAGNTRPIRSLSGTAKYRIPDILNETTIGEVKCTAYQAYTRQLHDYLLWARQEGLRMELHVRPDTVLSRPLQRLVAGSSIERLNDVR